MLWKHFFADNLFDKISNKLSNEILCFIYWL